MELLFQTNSSVAPLFVRVALGIVFFAHGAQKLFGWFGGQGLSATLTAFRNNLKIPAPLALLAILAEALGGLGLIVGFLARLDALAICATMVVAAYVAHAKFGFFLNWFGEKPGHGVEYHVLAVAMCLSVIVTGAGALSLDRAIACLFPHG
jgi:putative oxidoreductase